MEKNIIYFDGVCHLCDRLVVFIFRHSRKGTFYFAPIQGRPEIEALSGTNDGRAGSIVLDMGGRLFFRGRAIRKILLNMHFPFRILGIITCLLPNFLLNKLYDRVARNRYRMFGRKDVCSLPDLDDRRYFL